MEQIQNIIHKFYSKLVTHVQALETMGKLNMIDGYLKKQF